MLKPKDVKYLSDAWESVCEKRLKAMGYKVDKLDRGKARRMPDFLVSDSSGPLFVCEAKAILSGRYLADKKAHLSMADDDLPDGVVYEISLDKSKVDEDLHDASGKYARLIKERPKLKGIPMVVVFKMDFFAGSLSEYPDCMENHPTVSGLLTIVSDRKRTEWAHKMTLEELRARIEQNDMRGAPPNSKEFRLTENENPAHRLPKHFRDRCIRASRRNLTNRLSRRRPVRKSK